MSEDDDGEGLRSEMLCGVAGGVPGGFLEVMTSDIEYSEIEL